MDEGRHLTQRAHRRARTGKDLACIGVDHPGRGQFYLIITCMSDEIIQDQFIKLCRTCRNLKSHLENLRIFIQNQ